MIRCLRLRWPSPPLCFDTNPGVPPRSLYTAWTVSGNHSVTYKGNTVLILLWITHNTNCFNPVITADSDLLLNMMHSCCPWNLGEWKPRTLNLKVHCAGFRGFRGQECNRILVGMEYNVVFSWVKNNLKMRIMFLLHLNQPVYRGSRRTKVWLYIAAKSFTLDL